MKVKPDKTVRCFEFPFFNQIKASLHLYFSPIIYTSNSLSTTITRQWKPLIPQHV